MKNLAYKLIVFDWEGTLGDPLGHVHHALAAEALKLGLGAYDVTAARQYVALGLDKAVRKIFPDLSLYEYERLLLGVQQALVSNHGLVYLFNGAKALIEKLHHAGVLLAIATNKGQQSLERAVQASALTDFFDITRSAGELPAKPAPDMLADILALLDCTPQETLMIGDSVSDIEMANALQVASIAVDFYNQQADDLRHAGALEVFCDFKQLEDYLGV
jgi:phosphoglycolate phosphatase